MRLVFFGSDDFAGVNLGRLLNGPHQIAACVTPPDRARGRGLRVTAPPVKVLAEARGIPVLQPADIRDPDFIADLDAYQADVLVVIAYGRILPAAILDLPRQFAVNVHASLLPRYRGAAPINWAIINRESETGVSVIRLNTGMDAGDILSQQRVAIGEREDAVSLRARLAETGAGLLVETLARIERGAVVPLAQDPSQVTFAPKLTKSLGQIHWARPAVELDALIRGLQPWPSAYTSCQGRLLKIRSAQAVAGDHAAAPGTLVDLRPDGLVIATGTGGLLVHEVQPESGRPMPARDFVLGHPVGVGLRLGEC